MKKWWVVMEMMMVSEIALCQNGQWFYDFESWFYDEPLIIDTTSNPNNIWQIGMPQKQILNSAFSSPNVIVTDTVNAYPTNDTSSFIVMHHAWWGWWVGNGVEVTGYYSVNSDSLADYGMIEVSTDVGATWYNVDNVPPSSNCYSGNPQPAILTGNSNGWQFFVYCLQDLAFQLGIDIGDTVLYRFSFISDSIQANKDGLMFDNLQFQDNVMSIQELHSNNLLHLSPNPVSTELHITLDEPVNKGAVSLMSYEGKVISHQEINSTSATLDVRGVAPGMYYVLFRSEKVVAVRKVVVMH